MPTQLCLGDLPIGSGRFHAHATISQLFSDARFQFHELTLTLIQRAGKLDRL